MAAPEPALPEPVLLPMTAPPSAPAAAPTPAPLAVLEVIYKEVDPASLSCVPHRMLLQGKLNNPVILGYTGVRQIP